ncbi:alpha/beta hydrolase [Nitrospirillum sp. BR 11163]|uniref:alpha/beta fold hydrolase n=1 Tax=Nitrospirillum sp. BR 11163 TaxID=3104323 RepID=UPI002AFF51D9|nr:alpha/beta hydrolase [Nitrospirillum sp. BR 11163]MEA1674711.1 alpha/beta hydrolase [Nitrospirillum sp. BR 11163]
MSILTLRDGTDLYYKDWGHGQPVLFSHGWPLSADMWEYQMLHLARNGYRAVAFDRRGFGRSSQPWDGYDYDTLADDVARLIEHLDLRDMVLVGFSMGGGDVVRYLTRHGADRVAKLALVSAVTPFFLKTDDNPEGMPAEGFAGMRDALANDRPQFVADFSTLYFGTNRPGSAVSQGILDQTLQIAAQASIKATIDCVTAFSETDFRREMADIRLPTLIIHGDDDQTAPMGPTALATARLIPGAQLKIYPGAPHATCTTHKDQVNADLLAFLRD